MVDVETEIVGHETSSGRGFNCLSCMSKLVFAEKRDVSGKKHLHARQSLKSGIRMGPLVCGSRRFKGASLQASTDSHIGKPKTVRQLRRNANWLPDQEVQGNNGGADAGLVCGDPPGKGLASFDIRRKMR